MRQPKLLENGRIQAVRPPHELRMPVDSLIRKGSWEPLFNACSKFSSDFMPHRNQGDPPRLRVGNWTR